MNLSVVGKNGIAVKNALEKRGLSLVAPAQADVLLTYGGDGTLLGAEREYPGVVKFPIRDAETAPLCSGHSLERQLDALFAGRLNPVKLGKLECRVRGDRLLALNDIFVHNRDNAGALRFKIWIDGELYSHEIVGDGVGVATVHGSTAYYRSITHSMFKVGIGLAFSNSTEFINHMVLKEDSSIRLRINRGPAEVVADNSSRQPYLASGDECVIRLSDLSARFLGLDVFMCPECRRLRQQHRYAIFEPGDRN